jgi:hypothetical protein
LKQQRKRCFWVYALASDRSNINPDAYASDALSADEA